MSKTSADTIALFGDYLDAQMRLLHAGWRLRYDFTGVGYAVTATKHGRRTQRADSARLSEATIRLADRVVPGRK